MRLVDYICIVRRLPVSFVIRKAGAKAIRFIYYSIKKRIITKKPIDMDENIFANFFPSNSFLFDINDKSYYVSRLEGEKEQIIQQAEKICSHIFNLLGSGDKHLGRHISWNEDFKVGYIWENQFFKDIKIIEFSNNADAKVPWELSRFQHIPVLGQAYWITCEHRYAIEFKDQVNDWIQNNPIEMSVNWTCAMEVAIRACNWIVGYHYFKDSEVIDMSFWKKFNKVLYFHGEYIIRNLENTGFANNNHYISNLVGLIWLGMYFSNLDASINKMKHRTWLELGIGELEVEMKKQVNNDGTNFEASTAYHCLVTELLLYTTLLCSKNSIPFTPNFIDRLEKMCDVVKHITKPNGLIPIIGDMDNGRFIIFTEYGCQEKRDFRHLLGVAGEYFNRDDFRYFSGDKRKTALWMFKSLKHTSDIPFKLSSKQFSEGGFYILRNERIYVMIRSGKNGTSGFGGHTHNDQLSFELNIDGIDIIADPGTYVYTADYEMRNLFRCTSYHNTLQIEEAEQNTFRNTALFALANQTNHTTATLNKNIFIGSHNGYQSKYNVIHQREFHLYDNNIRILDQINPPIDKPLTIRFHFAPGTDICRKANSIIIGNKIELVLNSKYPYELKKSYFSSGYGQNQQISVIEFTSRENITEFEFEII